MKNFNAHFTVPTGSSYGDKLARWHRTSQATMTHYFELGYSDGKCGNYRGESVSRVNLNPAATYSYYFGFDHGRKQI